jgi:hypothetical protein
MARQLPRLPMILSGGISAGGDGGEKPKIIGNLGKIVMPFKLA